jgi:hypothetical protein
VYLRLKFEIMIKYVLFFWSLFALATAHAQLVNLTGESNVLYGTSANTSEELDLGWDVICNAATSTDIKCSATVIQMVAGAKYQYCWGAACSPWISANNALPEVVTMAAQESNSSFHIKYRHYGYTGQSIVRFCWYDANNAADIFCYDVNFCVDVEGGCVVDVQEVVTTASIAQISPNPASESASIAFSFSTKPANALLVVYNMVGETVATYPINQRQGQIRVIARELNSGIYFCSLMHEGKKLETKRLVVSH